MSDENKEKTNKPTAGFDTHPENINRKGRPLKGHSITETIREMMDSQPDIKKALGKKVLEMAMKGDIAAIKTIWSYLDGQPKQSVDVEMESNQTIAALIGLLDLKKEANE